MQQQPIFTAITTRAMALAIEPRAEEKCVAADLLMTAGEVAVALGGCWLLHLIA